MKLFSKIKGIIKSAIGGKKSTKSENVKQIPEALSEPMVKSDIVLSLTLGGMRCITQSVYIEKIGALLEKKGKHFSDVFTLITGAGAGAVAALMLAADDNIGAITRCVYSASDELFMEQKAGLLRLAESKYSSGKRLEFFEKIFQHRKLADVKCDVAMLAFDKVAAEPVVFTKEEFGDMLLKDVAMALTAEPVYFQSFGIKHKDRKYEFISAGNIAESADIWGLEYLRKKRENEGREGQKGCNKTSVKLIALEAYKNPLELAGIDSQKDWLNEGKSGFNMLQKLYRHSAGLEGKRARALLYDKVIEIGCEKSEFSDVFALDEHSISAIERLKQIAQKTFVRFEKDIEEFLS